MGGGGGSVGTRRETTPAEGATGEEVVLRVMQGRRLGVAMDGECVVTEVDPAVLLSGAIRPGDRIRSVDNVPVRSAAELHGLVNRRFGTGKRLLQLITFRLAASEGRGGAAVAEPVLLGSAASASDARTAASSHSGASGAGPPDVAAIAAAARAQHQRLKDVRPRSILRRPAVLVSAAEPAVRPTVSISSAPNTSLIPQDTPHNRTLIHVPRPPQPNDQCNSSHQTNKP